VKADYFKMTCSSLSRRKYQYLKSSKFGSGNQTIKEMEIVNGQGYWDILRYCGHHSNIAPFLPFSSHGFYLN